MWLRWVQAAMGVQVLVHVDHDHHFDHVDDDGEVIMIIMLIMIMLAMNLSDKEQWWILWLSWICAHWALLRLFDADESGNIELDEMFEIVATFYDMEVRQITQGDGTIPILM